MMFAKAEILYCVHALVSVRYREPRPDDTIFLYENLFLVRCASKDDDPWTKAEQIAKSKYSGREGPTDNYLEGRPSYHQYEGIRKIVAVDTSDESPEVTYLELEVADEKAVAALIERKPIAIVCYDDALEEGSKK